VLAPINYGSFHFELISSREIMRIGMAAASQNDDADDKRGLHQ
jgi:hypothetical protein